MKMDIDITDLNSHEIIRVLENYPKGSLKIKYDRVFWESLNLEPSPSSRVMNSFDPRQPPKGEGDIGKRFERMGDVLGRMVC
jgi:hypothetical protein